MHDERGRGGGKGGGEGEGVQKLAITEEPLLGRHHRDYYCVFAVDRCLYYESSGRHGNLAWSLCYQSSLLLYGVFVGEKD